MISLYEKTETKFDHNGLCALDGYIINPVVTEELNGLYMLEFDYPARAPHAQDIIPDRIVKCPVPDMPDQLFRVALVKKQLSGITHFTAYHVFYDLVDNLIEDTFVVNKNGQQAIAQILAATQYPHPFTGSSNIAAINNARIVRLNPAEVFLNADVDNGFLSRWGGEIIRDNFHFSIQVVRGSDDGVAIRDRKNLTGYTAAVGFNAVCTRIMPQGFDGLLLPEKYVDSPRINQYTRPKIRVIKYDSVKAAVGQYENAEDAIPLVDAYALLRVLAKKEFSENHIDLPQASYSVTFAPLAKTEEYKNFAALETVNIGDTVTVIHEADGFEVQARVMAYKFDPLMGAYISVTLGNYAPKFTDVVKDIKRVETGIQQAAAEANYALQSANGKNTNFYGPDTPANPRPGDLWYKENGDKLELWVYETRDGTTQWYPLLTDLTQEQMKADLAEAAVMVEEAKRKSDEAVAAGQQAAEAGADAKAAAEEAKIAGQEALAAGQAAKDAVRQAASDAQEAVTKANDAFNSAVFAVSSAGNAVAQASNAYNKSVKSTAVDYAVSASGVTAPASGWQASVPTVNAGQFLWTRTIITLQDGSTLISYGVSKQGADGATGAPGANGDTGPPGAKGDPGVKGDKGDAGAAGPAGAKGTDAPTITAVREQYYLSTSNTAQAGGNWNDTVPIWVSGRYYWARVMATYSDNSTTYSTPVLAEGLNNSLVTALEAKTATQSLQTTVAQHATSISLNANNITSLATRLTTAEASLTVQAGQIASKAAQITVDTLTGRVTAAESAIVQNADSFTLQLSKQSKAVNDIAGANILQTPWQQGNLSTSNGSESASTAYVRSGWLDVTAGKKYLLQTYEGAGIYGTAYLFYFREDKGFLSYTSVGNTTTPFTVPANARYLRVRLTTTDAPDTINCYLLQTDTTGGYVNLTPTTSFLKMAATTDSLLVTVSETKNLVGAPFKVSKWDRGTLNTVNGVEAISTSALRSGYIDVKPGEQYIAQTANGGAVTIYFHYFGYAAAYSGYIPAAAQYSEVIATGTYTNAAILQYLNYKKVEELSITSTITASPVSDIGDMLVIYRIPLEERAAPSSVQWKGFKNNSNNLAFLYTNGTWVQIGSTISATTVTSYTWALTDQQRMGITGGILHIAFFSVKTGTSAGITNDSLTPFTLTLASGKTAQLSYISTSAAITVPAGAVQMRVWVSTTALPEVYTGNVYPGNTRKDYSAGDTLYSGLLMQRDLINLRVGKNDVINQINLSTEGILIAGNKVRITGQTTIDNAVIQTAMIANLAVGTAQIASLAVSTAKIADAAITTAKIANLAVTNALIANAAIDNAKIANLDAGKITTGTLSADRIAAGSITSAKLTVANGFITNAMIADATIASAKIAALDAGKITTGTLAAARIAANSITADKLATNAIQVGLAGWTNTIRITPTQLSWYDGTTLTGYLDTFGMNFYYGTRFIGQMGQSYDAGNSNYRGIATHLNGQGDFVTWAYRTETSGSASYNRFFTLDPRGVLMSGQPGIHLGTNLRTNGFNFYTSGGRGVYLGDCGLSGVGTFPGWCGVSGGAQVIFGSNGHLYIVTGGYFYNMSDIVKK